MLEDIIKMLTPGEIRLLNYFKEKKLREAYESDISRELGIDLADVSRGALWLENKGLAERIDEKIKVIKITDKGNMYKEKPLPESILLKHIKNNAPILISELFSIKDLSKKEIEAALGLLLKRKLIRITKGEKGKLIELTDTGTKTTEIDTQEVFNKILSGETRDLPKDIIKELMMRGLIKEELVSRWKVRLTDKGVQLLESGIKLVETIDKLTPEIIVSRVWEKKPIRWYDVESPLPKISGGRKHPLRVIMEKIRTIFIEMGFKEMYGPWVELAFWNMDSMFIPQDHPAREIQDTFYLDNPKYGKVKDRELVEIVRQVQENGYDTGSLGWQQPWSEEVASRVLLRTHTTAVTFRVLGKLIRKGIIKPPVKFFSIGRVFRNEAIDWKHLAEFHQVEGFVVAENLTLRSLMGYIKEFYSKMGIKKLKFKPTYNPYTEPSMEIFAWHNKVSKWVEVGNSGLFRPETLRPYGIKQPVIAWGLAVERLASIVYEVEDIRKLIGPMVDVDWLRTYRIPVIKF